ncbi:MAG: acylphosphatase [candidate division WOR-3 bacterium]
MGIKRYHIRVDGIVQGVGFRYFTLRIARMFSIKGWVRNMPDESVEIEAEGEEENLKLFLEKIKEGPPAARVEKILVSELPPYGYQIFEIRF